MQRLLVSTSHEADYHAIARRLRGASAVWSGGSRACEPAVDLYDAVIVLRPGAETPADLARYVQTGKSILLTEPWKVEPKERRRLLSVAAAKDVRLWLVNPDRYLPSRRAIQQELAAGKLGRPGLVRIHHWAPAPYPRIQNEDHAVFGPLDSALWLFGSRPEVVYAAGATTAAGAYFQIHLGFAGGGMALLGISNWLPTGSGYDSLTVIGSSGAAYADDQQNVQLALSGGKAQAHLADERAAALAAMAQDFVDGQSEGPIIKAAEEAHLLGACMAVADSYRSRQAVRLEDV